jgi:hypothetical protein
MLALALALAIGQTSLSITLWPEGRSHAAHRYTLTCDPPGGTLPRKVAACRILRELGREAFAPIPRDAACTLQYGGPAEAVVRGLARGRRVWAHFARRNGCEIARWKRHWALLTRG